MQPEPDRVKHIQGQVEEVKIIMHDNIKQVLDRGVHLEQLQVDSERLAESAGEFKAQGTELRRAMCWKKCKITAIIVVVVLVIILFIVLVPVCMNAGCYAG